MVVTNTYPKYSFKLRPVATGPRVQLTWLRSKSISEDLLVKPTIPAAYSKSHVHQRIVPRLKTIDLLTRLDP